MIFVLRGVQSVLGIKEGDDSMSDVAQKVVELFLGVEFVSLVQGGVVVTEVFPDFLVYVVSEGRNQVNCASN